MWCSLGILGLEKQEDKKEIENLLELNDKEKINNSSPKILRKFVKIAVILGLESNKELRNKEENIKAANDITSYEHLLELEELENDWMSNTTRHYRIEGKQHARIRYGDEAEDWSADRLPCHDCGAVKGEYHQRECDVERCPRCGRQWITCGCGANVGDPTDE